MGLGVMGLGVTVDLESLNPEPLAPSPLMSAPQLPQNCSPISFSARHAEQCTARFAPHAAQKRRPGRFTWRHAGQSMRPLVYARTCALGKEKDASAGPQLP